MKVNMKQAGLRRRKGVTIVEVTVALAIIAVVSAAAVKMVLLSVGIETNFVTTKYTENNAQSVLDCFQFADNADEFYTALQNLDDFQPAGANTYLMESAHMTVKVVATFGPEKTLEYTAERQNGEVIFAYRFPYEGGGAE